MGFFIDGLISFARLFVDLSAVLFAALGGYRALGSAFFFFFWAPG